jgi:hypothetical protein
VPVQENASHLGIGKVIGGIGLHENACLPAWYRQRPYLPRCGMSETRWSALYSARRRGDVPAQLGLRTSCIRSWPVGIGQFLEPSTSEAARHEAEACCRHRVDRQAQVSRPPACIRSACRSSVQMSGKDRRACGIRHKAGTDGGSSGCEQVCAQASPGRGRPANGVPRDCVC